MAAAAAEARGGCAPLPVVWARTVHALRGWREPRGEPVPVCAEIASGHHARVRMARHAPREDWNEPMTAGALARWVLWNKETLRESVADYLQRFGLALG